MKKSPLRKASGSEAREYCFVIMSYRPRYDKIYEELCSLIERRTGLRCVRADREPEPGRDLLGKVHEMILRASLVIADVTEDSPNVYYEYGYASAHDRLPILIAKKGAKLRTDLVGKETLRYRVTPVKDRKFTRDLLGCVDGQLHSTLPEQRRMLAGEQPFPAYLIASPRVPGVGARHWWHPDERHTFGDMLGILGILTVYGNLFGTRHLPEVLNGQCVPRDVLARTANFFCIGSSKLNKATKYFLPRVQAGLSPFWRMPELGRGTDKRVVFKGVASIDGLLSAPVVKNPDRSISDYGLVIRAPHPQDRKHLVLIAAGRHSIGTHAACMMVTQQERIAALEEDLNKICVSLRDARQPFWCIVKGTALRDGSMLPKVEVVKLGGFVSR
jgi:hypothetical protein